MIRCVFSRSGMIIPFFILSAGLGIGIAFTTSQNTLKTHYNSTVVSPYESVVSRTLRDIPESRRKEWQKERYKRDILKRFNSWLIYKLSNWLRQTSIPMKTIEYFALFAFLALILTLILYWYLGHTKGHPSKHPPTHATDILTKNKPPQLATLLRRAREFAAQENFREALHNVFLAARESILPLSQYEFIHVTAREILPILQSHGGSTTLIDSWKQMIRPYEDAWFGHIPVQREDFDNFYALGIRVIEESRQFLKLPI